MTKKILHVISPLFFALPVFAFALILYPSKIGSEGFATAVLVSGTALGGAAIIRFYGRQYIFLLYFYLALCFGIPIVLHLFFNFLAGTELKVVFGIQMLGIVLLKLFVAYYWRWENRKKQEKNSDI